MLYHNKVVVSIRARAPWKGRERKEKRREERRDSSCLIISSTSPQVTSTLGASFSPASLSRRCSLFVGG